MGLILPRCRLLPALLLVVAAAVSAQLAIPAPPTRRINDYAGALAPADRERLEQKLIERERASSNQVVVVIFPSLAGENLEDFSVRLAQTWRIGQKGLDNGVVFLVFRQDRKMRLEVGYGLEATLTDATAASIIRDVVAPRFREGQFAQGIEAGLDAIDAAIAGTYVARPSATTGRSPWAGVVTFLPFALVAGFLAYAAVRIVKSLQRGRHRGGDRHRGGWVAPDGGGWSSSGGSSSDSFSGGGGSFGGGGASGDW